MRDRILLGLVALVALGAIVAALHYREQSLHIVRSTEPLPAPSVQHEVRLGDGERLRILSVPGQMFPETPDTCLLYTSTTSAAILRCRSWSGSWDTTRE